MFGAKPIAVPDPMTDEQLALGAFIGHVYCRRFRGHWHVSPGATLTGFHVTWPSGIAVNPFELLRRRLESGSDNLVLAQVAETLKPLIANGEAEDPPEIAAEWAAQAEDFSKDPARLPWALHFGKVAILDGVEGAAFRVRVAEWASALGKLNEAADLLTSATELEPGAAGPWFALAAAQTGLQKYRPAIESYRKAIALAPERAAALADTLMMLEALRDDADDPLV
jgi:tetratricopeptide (TPR) repeat protein